MSARADANAFAMVGGGWAFDDQEFPRFHECGMIDVAGFVVTAAAYESAMDETRREAVAKRSR